MTKQPHDRRATDIGRQSETIPWEVPDPYATEAGEKIVVLRQLRNDPLARLHSHNQIDDDQYLAGRKFQRDWETAERGPRGIDPTQTAVDGGTFPEPLTDPQRKAVVRLNKIRAVLGVRMFGLVHAVLIEGRTMEQISQVNVQGMLKVYGGIFRIALSDLAQIYGIREQPPQDMDNRLLYGKLRPKS